MKQQINKYGIALTLLFALFGNAKAQLTVQKSGAVTMNNTSNTTSLLTLTNSATNGIGINVTSNAIGAKIRKVERRGVDVMMTPRSNIACYGVYAYSSDSTSTSSNVAIRGTGGRTTGRSIGVHGDLPLVSKQLYGMKGAGVFGASSAHSPNVVDGIYAGYFYGDVKVTGALHGTLLTPSEISSNAIGDTYMSIVSSDDDNYEVSEKLGRVQMLQFYRPTPTDNQYSMMAENDNVNADSESFEADEIDGPVEEVAENPWTPQTELSTIKYGLAADQLREVFPELVYEDENGNLSINYIEMIPLLVQALNEQQKQIEQLKGNVTSPKLQKSTTTIKNGQSEDVVAIAQNTPNPFYESTKIECTIPKNIQNATIYIYDMTGKQIDKIVITERGRTCINVTNKNFADGMYVYTLIADGKVIGSKKMMLIK